MTQDRTPVREEVMGLMIRGRFSSLGMMRFKAVRSNANKADNSRSVMPSEENLPLIY